MPIDPYAALNAMIRAEASRFTPPARHAEAAASPKVPAETAAVEHESEPRQQGAPADSAA
ncbi:hypothetical protein ACFWUW_28635 [Streptomyces sp. NPDC058655]|uniref:hypothetical protein n=1 Tax=Streptomyces sp. NPDC058655 TaxID=3346577 RepID=UPI003655E4B0